MKTVIWMVVAGVLCVRLAAADEVPVATQVTHPMDALTADEMSAVVSILTSAGKADDNTTYATLTLREAPKESVRAWRAGQPFERRASVVLIKDHALYESVVNISRRRIDSWSQVHNKQSRLMNADFSAFDLVNDDPRFQQALRKRGYSPPYSSVRCTPLTPGPLSDAKLAGKRIGYAPCYDTSDSEGNPYGKPIEGLMVVVDMGAPAVVDVVDLGVVPVSDDGGSLRYGRSSKYRPPARPVEIAAPGGSNIVLDGSQVRWDNWRFHLRIDQRVGPIVSLVSYDDHGTSRSVLYQLSASEMFVPYMDPAATWNWRAYMDIGEYGFGMFTSVLRAGVDCPASARFMDATLPGDKGEPVVKKNIACLFERATGDPLWRHGGVDESRSNVELVVRMAPVVGNYDYFVDYVFDRAGDIDVRVGALGIDAVKGVVTKTLADASAKADTAYGTLIAKGLVGVNHDHYISFRIDADIDGTDNRVMLDEFQPQLLPKENPRRSLWRVKTQTVNAAGPFKDSLSSGFLRIESASRKNAMGNPTSYQLYPGHTESSLLAADDPIQIRAGWSRYPVWFSLYDADQLHASGSYPNLNHEADGLVKWTQGAQNIVNQDVVLWYNIGFRHITRAEDWPAMPAVWHSFRLRPFNFFDRSPAMDLEPEADVNTP